MKNSEAIKFRNTVALYNMVPNLIWSVLCLTPVFIFCYQLMSMSWFYIFGSVSLLTVLLPKSFLRRLQLSKGTSVYKKLGVKFINRFTQNGDIINRIIRKKNPDYKVFSQSQVFGKKLINQSYMVEKFHLILFTFFVTAAVYAIREQLYSWALIITLSNIIYNVYPVLLQQYIRIRIREFHKKSEHH